MSSPLDGFHGLNLRSNRTCDPEVQAAEASIQILSQGPARNRSAGYRAFRQRTAHSIFSVCDLVARINWVHSPQTACLLLFIVSSYGALHDGILVLAIGWLTLPTDYENLVMMRLFTLNSILGKESDTGIPVPFMSGKLQIRLTDLPTLHGRN